MRVGIAVKRAPISFAMSVRLSLRPSTRFSACISAAPTRSFSLLCKSVRGEGGDAGLVRIGQEVTHYT